MGDDAVPNANGHHTCPLRVHAYGYVFRVRTLPRCPDPRCEEHAYKVHACKVHANNFLDFFRDFVSSVEFPIDIIDYQAFETTDSLKNRLRR